jgi:uncharacterized protein
MTETLRVPIDASHRVTAIVYPAAGRRVGVTLILGHGAGAGQTSRFMVSMATALAARGIDTATFNFLYMEEKRRLPDPNPRLEACYQAVIAVLRGHKTFGRGALAIGGKSMGGRIASQVAASGTGDLAGLVLLGYPLHPPGKPDQRRIAHLPKIIAPMLFVQGARDSFGTPEELRPVLQPLPARSELYVVDHGDHSFKVPKRSGVAQEDIEVAIQDKIADWLRRIAAQ